MPDHEITINGKTVKEHDRITVGDEPHLSDAGLQALITMLSQWKLAIPSNTTLNDDLKIRNVGAVNGGAYRGKLPKRLSVYYHKLHAIELDPGRLAAIGTLVERYTDNPKAVFDFDQQIDWTSGAYGDTGACFMSYALESRLELQENGFWAVRFYGEKGKGIARSWLYRAQETPELWCQFNGYGYDIQRQVKIIATYFGLLWRPFNFHFRLPPNRGANVSVNYGSPHLLSLDPDARLPRGYLMLRPTSAETRTNWFFRDPAHLPTCRTCGKPLDRATYQFPRRELSALYCPDCADRRIPACVICGNRYPGGDLYSLHGLGRVCYECKNSDKLKVCRNPHDDRHDLWLRAEDYDRHMAEDHGPKPPPPPVPVQQPIPWSRWP